MKNQLTDEERNHHRLLVSVGMERNNKLMAKISDLKERFLTIIMADFAIISIVSPICIYLFSEGWSPSFIECLFLIISFLIFPFGLLIWSIWVSAKAWKKRTFFWDIMAYDEKSFEKYMLLSEDELFDDFLTHLKKYLVKNTKIYEKLASEFNVGLNFLLYSIPLFITFITTKIISNIG